MRYFLIDCSVPPGGGYSCWNDNYRWLILEILDRLESRQHHEENSQLLLLVKRIICIYEDGRVNSEKTNLKLHGWTRVGLEKDGAKEISKEEALALSL